MKGQKSMWARIGVMLMALLAPLALMSAPAQASPSLPETAQSETAQSETAQSETAQSETAQSETAQSELDPPEISTQALPFFVIRCLVGLGLRSSQIQEIILFASSFNWAAVAAAGGYAAVVCIRGH